MHAVVGITDDEFIMTDWLVTFGFSVAMVALFGGLDFD